MSEIGAKHDEAKKPYPLGWIDVDNDPLMMMVQLKRDELFQHPLMIGLLELRRMILYTFDIYRIVFALLFAIFISIIMTKHDPSYESCWTDVNVTIDHCSLNATCLDAYVTGSQSMNYTALFILACIGFVITFVQILSSGTRSQWVQMI